jgi:predicted nucleic acid-binding protein
MIIVDTNVILSALLTEGITKVVITSHKGVFETPQWCFDELWEHRDVWNKNDLCEKDLKNSLSRLKRYVKVVDEEKYIANLDEAKRLIIDPDDVPVIALALSVDNEGIWTYNTRHFKGDKLKGKVKILNIKEVIIRYQIEVEE